MEPQQHNTVCMCVHKRATTNVSEVEIAAKARLMQWAPFIGLISTDHCRQKGKSEIYSILGSWRRRQKRVMGEGQEEMDGDQGWLVVWE